MAGKPQVRDRQQSFAGGMHNVEESTPDLYTLTPHQYVLALNMKPTLRGGLINRRGSWRLSASPIVIGVSVVGLGVMHGSGTTATIAVVNGRAYVSSGVAPADSPTTAWTWTALGAGGEFNVSSVPMMQFRNASIDPVMFLAGVTQLYRYNGSGLAAVTGSPAAATALCVYNRRLFAAKGNTLYWSALDDGETWSGGGAGSAVIRTTGLGPIMGLGVAGDSLVMLHANGVSVFTGWSQDDIAIQSGTSGLDGDFGCNHPRSVVVAEGHVYAASGMRGIVRANATQAEAISDPVELRLRQAMALQSTESAFGCYDPMEQLLFFANGRSGIAASAPIFVYDVRRQVWVSEWRLRDATDSFDLTPTAMAWHPTGVLLVGCSDGYVRALNPSIRTDTDPVALWQDDCDDDMTDGTDLQCAVASRYLDHGDWTHDKEHRFLRGVIQCDEDNTVQVQLTNGTAKTLDIAAVMAQQGVFSVDVEAGAMLTQVSVLSEGSGEFAIHSLDLLSIDHGERL